MADFYLASTELRDPYEPRECEVIKRLKSEIRDDLALVKVSPPLPKEIYDTAMDLEYLILATRLEGDSIFSPANWPIAVYICLLKETASTDAETINSRQLTILDWGELQKK